MNRHFGFNALILSGLFLLSSCCFGSRCKQPAQSALIDIKCANPQKFRCDLGDLTISAIPLGAILALDPDPKHPRALLIKFVDTTQMKPTKLLDTTKLEVATGLDVECSGTSKDSIIKVEAKSRFQKSLSVFMKKPIRLEFTDVVAAINKKPNIKKTISEYVKNNPNQYIVVVKGNISTTSIKLGLVKSDSMSLVASIDKLFKVDAQVNYTCGSSYEGSGETSASQFVKITEIVPSTSTPGDYVSTTKDNLSLVDFDLENALTANKYEPIVK